jgi:hypothetical protein
VQHVIGVAADRHVEVMENDRVALRGVRRVRELEGRLHVAAAEGVLVRHDAAILEGRAFDQQRRERGPLLRRRGAERRGQQQSRHG